MLAARERQAQRLEKGFALPAGRLLEGLEPGRGIAAPGQLVGRLGQVGLILHHRLQRLVDDGVPVAGVLQPVEIAPDRMPERGVARGRADRREALAYRLERSRA